MHPERARYSNPKPDVFLVGQAFLPARTDKNVCATGEATTDLGLLYNFGQGAEDAVLLPPRRGNIRAYGIIQWENS